MNVYDSMTNTIQFGPIDSSDLIEPSSSFSIIFSYFEECTYIESRTCIEYVVILVHTMFTYIYIFTKHIYIFVCVISRSKSLPAEPWDPRSDPYMVVKVGDVQRRWDETAW